MEKSCNIHSEIQANKIKHHTSTPYLIAIPARVSILVTRCSMYVQPLASLEAPPLLIEGTKPDPPLSWASSSPKSPITEEQWTISSASRHQKARYRQIRRQTTNRTPAKKRTRRTAQRRGRSVEDDPHWSSSKRES